MEKAKQIGIDILTKHHRKTNDAVMFDIDDTLIYYNKKPNNHMIELAKVSKDLGYKLIIITARPDFIDNRNYTEFELTKHNIPFDLLFYAKHEDKGYIKNQLSSQIVLSVGDMWTDLTNTLHYIKLPSQYLNETFYECA